MKWAICFCAALFLTGCGARELFFSEQVELKPGYGQMSDIKQRGVFVQSRPDAQGVPSPVVCAEPSPDAMAAVAASIAANAAAGGSEDASGGFSATIGESAAFVGLRTQTIQLLRDGFYRMCEGYMSGALTGEDYSIMQRRYQSNMLALLAIEQLTGTNRSPAVTIDTATKAMAARKVEEVNAEIDAENKKGDKKSEARITELQNEKKVWERLLTETGSLSMIAAQTPTQLQSTEKVAAAVQQIVKLVVEQDKSGALCFEYFRRRNSLDSANPLTSFCTRYLNVVVSSAEAKVRGAEDCFREASQIPDRAKRAEAIAACDAMRDVAVPAAPEPTPLRDFEVPPPR